MEKLTSINYSNMHISEGMYTEKVHKETKSGSKVTKMCCYTLKGGGYLVTETICEEIPKDWGMEYKTVSENAYATEKCPEMETKDEALAALKKYAESLTK
jgi:hypothetical protein